MNGLRKIKILFLFLAISLAFSGLTLQSFSAFSSPASGQTEQQAANTLPRVAVISGSSANLPAITLAQNILATGCAATSVSGFLQSTVGAALFTKAADCFTLAPVRTQTVRPALSVVTAPQALPQIVVVHVREKIESAFNFPAAPYKEGSGVLPAVVALSMLVSLALVRRFESRNKLSYNNNNFLSGLTLEQLQVFRC